jgi:hypothetical protein
VVTPDAPLDAGATEWVEDGSCTVRQSIVLNHDRTMLEPLRSQRATFRCDGAGERALNRASAHRPPSRISHLERRGHDGIALASAVHAHRLPRAAFQLVW